MSTRILNCIVNVFQAVAGRTLSYGPNIDAGTKFASKPGWSRAGFVRQSPRGPTCQLRTFGCRLVCLSCPCECASRRRTQYRRRAGLQRDLRGEDAPPAGLGEAFGNPLRCLVCPRHLWLTHSRRDPGTSWRAGHRGCPLRFLELVEATQAGATVGDAVAAGKTVARQGVRTIAAVGAGRPATDACYCQYAPALARGVSSNPGSEVPRRNPRGCSAHSGRAEARHGHTEVYADTKTEWAYVPPTPYRIGRSRD